MRSNNKLCGWLLLLCDQVPGVLANVFVLEAVETPARMWILSWFVTRVSVIYDDLWYCDLCHKGKSSGGIWMYQYHWYNFIWYNLGNFGTYDNIKQQYIDVTNNHQVTFQTKPAGQHRLCLWSNDRFIFADLTKWLADFAVSLSSVLECRHLGVNGWLIECDDRAFQ